VLVSLIIPCYNEEATIEEVLTRLAALRIDGAETEIVVVNDGSTDRTAERIEGFPFPPGVRSRIYHAPINFGKGAGVRVGMALASGDVIAIQDADLELDPADLPQLIAPVVRGEAEVMFGSRFLDGFNQGIPRKTRLANWFLAAATNLLFGGGLTDMETAYKVFSRRVRDRLRLRCVEFDIEPEITAKMLRLGCQIQELPIRYRPRTAAQGKTIGLWDGIDALWTLWRIRWLPLSKCERGAARALTAAPAAARPQAGT
jgi:glycosyltransferase involved in cell wall biosynthesis